MTLKERIGPEAYRAHWRAYNLKRKAYLAEYRIKNKENSKKQAQTYAKTPEGSRKQRERNARFRAKNPGRNQFLTKLWQKRNPDKLANLQSRRYARKKNAEGGHTTQEWLDLCQKHQFLCAYCGHAGLKLSRDHIISLSCGGSDYITNILPSCRPCNSAKGNRVDISDLDLWIKQRRSLPNA